MTTERLKAQGERQKGTGLRVNSIPRRLSMLDCSLAIGPCNEDPTKYPRTRTLQIIAKTTAPCFVPTVNADGSAAAPIPLYFDLAGMRSAYRISIDREHCPTAIIGWGRPSLVDGPAIAVSGEAVMLDEDSPAEEVAGFSDAGVPFQASIAWDPQASSIEELDAGKTATVNGQAVTGPALIAREWPLLNVSVVLLGDDSATGAYFLSANMEGRPLSIDPTLPAAPPVPAPAAPPPPAAPPAAPAAPAAPPAPTAPAAPPVAPPAAPPPSSDLPAEVSPPDSPAPAPPGEVPTRPLPLPETLSLIEQFTGRFGAEQGIAYLKARLSFTEALERDHDRLQKELAAANKALAETNARLSQVRVGLPMDRAPTFNPADRKEAASAGVSARERAIGAMKMPSKN
jgi:hypothetical protein